MNYSLRKKERKKPSSYMQQENTLNTSWTILQANIMFPEVILSMPCYASIYC